MHPIARVALISPALVACNDAGGGGPPPPALPAITNHALAAERIVGAARCAWSRRRRRSRAST